MQPKTFKIVGIVQCVLSLVIVLLITKESFLLSASVFSFLALYWRVIIWILIFFIFFISGILNICIGLEKIVVNKLITISGGIQVGALLLMVLGIIMVPLGGGHVPIGITVAILSAYLFILISLIGFIVLVAGIVKNRITPRQR